MKEKNSYTFWIKWFGVAIIHSIIFTWIWLLQAYGSIRFDTLLYNFASGLALAILHYWAMPFTIRPNTKRWFIANIFSFFLPMLIQYFQGYTWRSFDVYEALNIYLPLAISQSWALNEHLKNTLLYGIAILIAAMFFIGVAPHMEIHYLTDMYFTNAFVHLAQATILGITLFLLNKYQRKSHATFGSNSTTL